MPKQDRPKDGKLAGVFEQIALKNPLPSNAPAERSVLGSVFNGQTAAETLVELAIPEDFTVPENRIVFAAIKNLIEAGQPVDRITIYQEVSKVKWPAGPDGPLSYLATLHSMGLPDINIEAHVHILHEIAKRREIIRLSFQSADAAMSGEDPSDLILQGVTDSCERIQRSIGFKEELQDPGQIMLEDSGSIAKFVRPHHEAVYTCFPRLDDILGGLQPGLLYIIGGETSHGKSSLALNIAENIAMSGYPVLYFTMEMSRKQLIHRIICSRCQIAMGRFRRGHVSDMERFQLEQEAKNFSTCPLFIDETSGLSAAEFYAKSLRAVRNQDIRVIFVDYLQIMDLSAGQNGQRLRDEREGISFITRTMKDVAKRLATPVVLLSQLSRVRGKRAPKDFRPKLSDYHGSSSIEKDCDVGMMIYREEFDKPDLPGLKGTAEIIIAKQRDGPTGAIPFKFESRFTRFTEVREEESH
jgi:replicative DNA helicase